MSTTLVIFTKPAAGKEDEYNEWYNTTHLTEVLALPGFESARRFKLASDQLSADDTKPPTHDYLALYELSIDAKEAFEILLEEVGTGRMVLPDCIDATDIQTMAYDQIASMVAPEAVAR